MESSQAIGSIRSLTGPSGPDATSSVPDRRARSSCPRPRQHCRGVPGHWAGRVEGIPEAWGACVGSRSCFKVGGWKNDASAPAADPWPTSSPFCSWWGAAAL